MEVAINRKVKRSSYWSSAWRRFKRNKMAVAGLIYIIIIIIVSIFTPWIAPYPYDEPHYAHTLKSRVPNFGGVLMTLEEICLVEIYML